MNYIFLILTLISIYSLLALSLNLQVGYTGLLSLSHAAFYGVGAYISSLLMVNGGWHFIPALAAAVLGAMVLSFIIALPSLRLHGDYYLLASLGFQSIVFVILYNWVEVTNGSYGLSDIPRPNLFGIEIASIAAYFIFCGAICVFCAGLIYLLCQSPFGRVLKAVREDALSAEALGKPVFRLKILISVIASGFAAVAGVLFAGYARYLDPTTFTLDESIFVLSMVIIGGAGNFAGPIAGAIMLVVLPEALRFLGISDAVAANVRQIIYGLSIIVLMRYRPQGVFGEFKFQ